ncbi:hypothetical protein DAPPUDRAFT_302251 [Daphnia pulex]|uniref:U6 snRNA phosphodiesterase n=1 Tax=Daphnia pulex TaxID=6669 RepID=E9HMQ4_DAPPU|nr:hypothetical protein DAPPUDRAFT_302251 [Daphnia pulex]|eukprot:EFX66971.1 hypothetical protein DAPPUDRAFT_302251 [Daphnia pulex]
MDMIAAAYGCESDEEDSDPWASSRVSAKRTIGRDEEFSSRPFKKVPNRLPAPKLITHEEPDEVVDDPSQHGNRIRSFPHERGNWASFIYLPWEGDSNFVNSVELITQCFQNYGIELQICDDFHISLTKTFILRHHWIEGFVNSVKKQLNGISRPFQLLGTNVLSVYTNEERNRTFLAINIEDPSGMLNVLTQKMDSCMIEYQLPTFYKEACHHVSIAWCVCDKKEELEKIAAGLKLEIEQTACNMAEVRCKIGNLVKRL